MFLTVFTPTYNRAHTLGRLYESLCKQKCNGGFEWLVVDDGSTDSTRELILFYINEGRIPIRYIYKENGGLHTGYNTAYANMDSVLSMCMDSDDYLPDGAIEKIEKEWTERGCEDYAGLLGLAYNHDGMFPIGGLFPDDLGMGYFLEIAFRHRGDSAPVLRTDLMKTVAPQIGFKGEKNFNPVYMIMQVCDNYPLIVVNDNLMIKEYQKDDSMSKAIFKQYINSPRSFAKMRVLEMQLKHNTNKNRFRSAIHYVSSCIIANDCKWFENSPKKILTLLAVPFGILLAIYIKFKVKN